MGPVELGVRGAGPIKRPSLFRQLGRNSLSRRHKLHDFVERLRHPNGAPRCRDEGLVAHQVRVAERLNAGHT
jgi:hypothetical protein